MGGGPIGKQGKRVVEYRLFVGQGQRLVAASGSGSNFAQNERLFTGGWPNWKKKTLRPQILEAVVAAPSHKNVNTSKGEENVSKPL